MADKTIGELPNLPAISPLDLLVAQHNEEATKITGATLTNFFKDYIGPVAVTSASQMTNTNKVYIYVGNESGYTNGNWYYYNGSRWVSGGAYNSQAINTDATLTHQGVAADAEAAGKIVEISETQPAAPANRVWIPETQESTVQIPTWAEHQALNNAINSLATVISVSQLSDLSGGSSRFINFGANVTVDAYTIPRYSKGVIVASSGTDAVLIAISPQGVLYTAFRNAGTWTKTDLKSYVPVVRSTPVAIPSSSATYTLDGITPYYHLVSWGFQDSSGNPIPENKAPCDLTWTTATGTFTITKTDDRPLSGQKICPIFEYALDKQAT